MSYCTSQEDHFVFCKKFTFSSLSVPVEISCLKPFKNSEWKVPELYNLKNHLNATKQILKAVDSDTWHCHTAFTNRAAAVFHAVKNKVAPELLTQAWLKFYECISSFPVVKLPHQSESICSVHLCEAPGAFVTSLNHYIQSHHQNLKLDWYAVSLNPYYEGNSLKQMISDDYFIQLSSDHWIFGSSNTGNILDPNNILEILGKVESKFVHLVTADGSVDCSDSPGNQEITVNQIKWCEVITALSVLGNGGSFVMKLFTIFEETTVSLLYLLRICFSELHVFKPVTSKEGNSEVYLISLSFNKTPSIQKFVDSLLNYLLSQNIDKHPFAKPLFAQHEVPSNFVQEIVNCSKLFTKYQEEAILRNLSIYNSECTINQQMLASQKKIARLFLQIYRLKKISEEKTVSRSLRRLERLRIKLSTHRKNHMLDVLGQVLNRNFHLVEEHFNKVLDEIYSSNVPLTSEIEFEQNWNLMIKPVYGKHYLFVSNSRFCDKIVFQIYYHLLNRYIMNNGSNMETLASFLSQENQCIALVQFLKSATRLQPGQALEVRNVPILSRFSASILWLMSKCFKTMELIPQCHRPCILLSGFEIRSEVLSFLENVEGSALSLVDISQLLKSPFADILNSYNTLLLIGYLKTMLGF